MPTFDIPSSLSSARVRHDQLSRVVRDARYRYYVLSDLAMPDAEFDARLQELEAIEAAFPVLQTPESPTQQVGAPLDQAFPPFEHLEAMMSLDNVFSEADLRAWSERVVRGRPPYTVVIGNASSVRVTYDDKPVDLAPHTRADVARLTIP